MIHTALSTLLVKSRIDGSGSDVNVYESLQSCSSGHVRNGIYNPRVVASVAHDKKRLGPCALVFS